MHPDIEKLLSIAKENGALTEKQREIILRKAEQLGEDIDEIVFILESFSKSPETVVPGIREDKSVRCKNCGAILPALSGFCPECGTPVEKESSGAQVTRSNMKSFSERLASIQSGNNSSGFLAQLLSPSSSKSEVVYKIQSFSVPLTVESLTQGFNYAMSNYHSHEGDISSSEEAMAWYSKAKEFYSQIASMREKDQKTEQWLQDNGKLLRLSFSQKQANIYSRIMKMYKKMLIPLIIFLVLDLLIMLIF